MKISLAIGLVALLCGVAVCEQEATQEPAKEAAQEPAKEAVQEPAKEAVQEPAKEAVQESGHEEPEVLELLRQAVDTDENLEALTTFMNAMHDVMPEEQFKNYFGGRRGYKGPMGPIGNPGVQGERGIVGPPFIFG